MSQTKETMVITRVMFLGSPMLYRLRTPTFSCTRRTEEDAIKRAEQDLKAGYIGSYYINPVDEQRVPKSKREVS